MLSSRPFSPYHNWQAVPPYRYYSSFLEDDAVHILMEFAEQGDLYRVRSLLIHLIALVDA